MNTYEINSDTLAIISKDNSTSIVYENDNTFIVNRNIIDIINDSCKYYGSTFEGRKIGASEILNIYYKTPILIEESSYLIFFPTSSTRYKNCAWISLNNINKYEKNIRGSLIKFNNGRKIIIPISFNILKNQILRSSRLAYLLKSRKIKNY